MGLLLQESQLPPNQRGSQLFDAHVQRLVARHIIRPNQALHLPDLGLLTPPQAKLRVGELSMGQQRRLELALLLASRPHVLLLDEPANHLSIRLIEELTAALEKTQAAVVLATHDRQLLRDTQHRARLRLSPSGQPAGQVES